MATLADRRRATAAASKERRKKIFAIVGIVVLLILLVIQVPRMLDLLSSDATVAPVAAPAPATTTPAEPTTVPLELRQLRSSPGRDPFAAGSLAGGDAAPRFVAGPARDPFLPPGIAPVVAPRRIVVGTPTAGSTPTVGYIVVLASIRISAGRGVAERIAATARSDGLQNASVLDSSTSRPLRSGYYVAYLGPYSSGSAVRAARARAIARGYRTAYTRELVRYSG